MTTWNDPSHEAPARTILTRLRSLFATQEKTHEQVLRNGDGIRDLQVLLDLFRHPGVSMEELAQKLDATLEEIQRSAKLMADGITPSTSQLTTLRAEADRRDAEIAELIALVRSQQSELSALRAETRHLSHYLGLDRTLTADDA